MKKILFKITLHFNLIIHFIKCFSESNIKYLVEQVDTLNSADVPKYSSDYYRMPFSSFGLNPNNPSFTIVGNFYGKMEKNYQSFFQIYKNINPQQKIIMFGFDELKSSVFIRQQYAANSYNGEILCSKYTQEKQNSFLQTQFTISLKKSATQTEIFFLLTENSQIICYDALTISSNMLDWNSDFTVQFSDSGAPVPPNQRKEYSAAGSVFGVFLIRDTYIGSYGIQAIYFLKQIRFKSQEGIYLINKFNQISDIKYNCIPDESIQRTTCAKSTISNQLPKIDKVIATFQNQQDIKFQNLSLNSVFYSPTFLTPYSITYSFWLNIDEIKGLVWLLIQYNKQIFGLYIMATNKDNGYIIQILGHKNGQYSGCNSNKILNFKKFYYLIFYYYQDDDFVDMKILMVDDNGVFSNESCKNIQSLFLLSSSDSFELFQLQIGSELNKNITSFFQISQFQMNLNAPILYDEQDYPVVVDSTQIIQNCQVVILIRLKYQCLVCKVGFYLFENKCKNSCNTDYIPNKNLRICVRVCSYRCSTCQQNDPNKCITCSSPDRDLSTNCGCTSGYEDLISSECSKFKAQNMYNSDIDLQYIYYPMDNNINELNRTKYYRIFRRQFKKIPYLIPMIRNLRYQGNNIIGAKIKTLTLTESEFTIEVQLPQGFQSQTISMDPKKYYSQYIEFNTPKQDTYLQNVDIGSYDITKYGDYQVLIFISGIMIDVNATFTDFKIEVVNNKKQIQVTVQSGVKSIAVTYLVLPTSTPSLFQSFTFKDDPFYNDTTEYFISKVHQDTISIQNNFIKSKKYLFTPFFSLTSLTQSQKESFDFDYSYQPQIVLDQQPTIFNIDYYQFIKYSTNGFYFLEEFNQQYDQCAIKDYYTQEGCYKCKILNANLTDSCNSCQGNRIVKVSSCDCPDSDFKKNYADEMNCSYKNIAVLDVKLSTDFSQIVIDFGLNIEPIKFQLSINSSYELCKHLFSQDTLNKLQKSASCQISSTTILINLDKDASIMKGDVIKFNQNLKFIKYTDEIKQFYRTTVNQDQIQNVADVDISYSKEYNSCGLNMIQVLEFKNDSKRGVQNFQWSLVPQQSQINSNDLSKIQELFDTANSKQSLTLFINGYFQENSVVTILFQYTYKIGIKGEKKITFKIISQTNLILTQSQMKNQPYFKKDSFEIFYQINFYKCDINGKAFQISPATFNLKYQTSDNLQLTNTIASTTERQFSIIIPSYTAQPNINYKITLFCTVSGTFEETQITYELPIKAMALLIQIKGGNRSHDCKQQLIIEALSKDLDEKEEENQSKGINLKWTCSSLENNKPCTDIGNQIINVPQGSNVIKFPKNTFICYQTLQFTLLGTKGTKKEQSEIIILFVDQAIPTIQVNFSDEFLLKPTVNLNDIIEASMAVDSKDDVNKLFFGGVIIYNQEVQQSINFEYGKVRIQLWDYFSNFDENNPKFQLRFVVFNPKYSQPSQMVIQLKLNFPPQKCFLDISPSNGNSLTTLFTISTNNCIDFDSPIQYQYYYYSSPKLFDFEKKNPLLVQRKQLSDKLFKQQIQTYLPSGEILILVQAIDSLGAIQNITKAITVQQSIFSQEQYTNQIQNLINESQKQIPSNQILILSLLCEDIVQRQDYFQSIRNMANQIVSQLQKLTNEISKDSTFSTLATQSVQLVINSKVLLADKQLNQQMLNYISEVLNKASLELKQDKYLQEKSNQQLYHSFKVLDSLADISQTNIEDQKSLTEYAEKVGKLLNVDSYPNESAKILKGEKISIISQVITRKKLPYYLGQETEQSNWEKQLSEQIKDDSVNQVYDVSFKSYEQNIYQNSTEFQNLVNEVKATNPKFILNSYKTIDPQIKSHLQNDDLVLQDQKVKFSFQPKGQEKLTCVNKVKGKWSAQGCISSYDKLTKQYNCVCDTLSPTTVINDIGDIFTNNKNIDTVFSGDGIQNIIGFDNFQDYAAFWVQCFIAIIFIIFSIFGIYLDSLIIGSHKTSSIKPLPSSKPQQEIEMQYPNAPKVINFDLYNQRSENKQFSSQDFESSALQKKEGSEVYNQSTNADILEKREQFQNASFLKTVFYFHELFSIFLIYDTSISRLQRFTIVYLKNLHIFTTNILFNQQHSIVQTIFIQIFNLIVSTLITKALTFGVSKNNMIIKRVCQFLVILIICLYYYAFLAIISSYEPRETNTLSKLYFGILLIDILAIGGLLSFIYRSLSLFILQNEQNLIKFKCLFQYLKLGLILKNI